MTLFKRSCAVIFEACPVVLSGCVNTSEPCRSDVEPMPMLGLIGLRGLRGLMPPARPCGVDLFDTTGVTVGGDTGLHWSGAFK